MDEVGTEVLIRWNKMGGDGQKKDWPGIDTFGALEHLRWRVLLNSA